MIRVNGAWLITTKEQIDEIDLIIPEKTALDNLGVLVASQVALESIFNNSLYGNYLRASRTAGIYLHGQLTNILNHEDRTERKINAHEVESLKASKNKFNIVFLADLGIIPLYIVSKKETFDVNLLIESGIELFQNNIMTKAPEVERDAAEVGKALAYELPTACGFHSFRVIESVTRRYWDAVSEGKPRPEPQTLGTFAAEMTKNNIGDNRVIEAVKQMTKLHRNPLIHPEVMLSIEEAIGIIGMARSVIAMMLKVLPDVPQTTGA